MPEIELLERFKIYLFLSILLFFSEISGQIYPDATVDSLLRTGINNVINQNYGDANKIFSKLNNNYPSLPLGKIYLAANKIAEAYDYSEDFDEEYIRNTLEEARKQAEELIENDDLNIWYQYFLALCEGYTSYFEALNGSWFSALSTGVNSISEFEEILKTDDKFFEAYIAIGTFQYWKSRKLEFISWVPFSNDTRKLGIEFLITAIESASYNSHLAINSLIWIYIDQNKYEEAIKVAQKALKEFPESRTFQWGMARAYEDVNPSQAILLYQDILASYPTLRNGNYKNEITLKHLIAQQYARLDNKEMAIKYCDEILSMKNVQAKTMEELSDRIQRVKELKEELTEKN